jgi:hypothetical protein
MANSTQLTLCTAQSATSANGNGAAVNTRNADQLIAYVNVTNVTAGSVTFTIQVAPTSAGPWCAHTAGASISAAGTQAIRATDCVGSWARLAWVVATGPVSFDAAYGEAIDTAVPGKIV